MYRRESKYISASFKLSPFGKDNMLLLPNKTILYYTIYNLHIDSPFMYVQFPVIGNDTTHLETQIIITKEIRRKINNAPLVIVIIDTQVPNL